MAASTTQIYPPTPQAISMAGERLRQGEIVAIPTETVYGLAADATSDQAVAKIYALKNRPCFNPLIIHVDTFIRAKALVEWNEAAEKLATAFWPGPVTLVLPRQKTSPISQLASAGLDTLALRMPAHDVAHHIIAAADRPLAAPSANPSEALSPTTAQHVLDAFKDHEHGPMIIDGGPCTVGLESTIVDVSSKPTLLRCGAITQKAIEDVIGPLSIDTSDTIRPKAPGQMLRHYAPRHPMRINATHVTSDEALLAFGPSPPLQGALRTLNLSPKGDLLEAAAHLFAMLHELDRVRCEGIAVMPIPEEGLGLAINDRLKRGAS